MNTRFAILFSFLGGLSSGLVGCLEDKNLAGGTSDIGNAGIVGFVLDDKGQAIQNARVWLLPEGYKPMVDSTGQEFSQRGRVTSQTGYFHFDKVDSGRYNLIVRDLQKKTASLSSALLLNQNRQRDTLRIQPKQTGSARIRIRNPDLNAKRNSFIYLPGTDIYHQVNQVDVDSGFVEMQDIPEGKYTELKVAQDRLSVGEALLFDTLSIKGSAATEVGPYAGWSYKLKVGINTAKSGANIHSHLMHYPLAIRLNTQGPQAPVDRAAIQNISEFFQKAEMQGADLRVTKSDGFTPIPFELESWNQSKESANIWVKLDTLNPMDSTQFLILYVGKSEAKTLSSGKDVFPTSEGYRNIWHLSDDPVFPVIHDALGNNSGKLYQGLLPAKGQGFYGDGLLGQALNLPGEAERMWINLGREQDFVSKVGQVSISLWINPANLAQAQTGLISFSIQGELNPNHASSRVSLNLNGNSLLFQVRDSDSAVMEGLAYNLDTVKVQSWIYITGMVDIPKDTLLLFMDGELVASKKGNFLGQSTSFQPSTSSSIGANDLGTEDFFQGRFDEIRLEHRMNSPDWIRMNFASQRPGNGVIRIQKRLQN